MADLREISGIPKGAPKTETFAPKRMINVDKLLHELLMATTSISPRSPAPKIELARLAEKVGNIRTGLRKGDFDA